ADGKPVAAGMPLRASFPRSGARCPQLGPDATNENAARDVPGRRSACRALLAWGRPPEPAAAELLDRDRSAGALEGSLRLLRGLLVDLLEDGLRRAVDQVLGLLETEAGERAHLLDDLNLLVASGLKDDVELVLLHGLFGSGGSRAASGRNG